MTVEEQKKQIIEARVSSINSLKELIIILTGLTITSGFLISFHSVHKKFPDATTGSNFVQAWQTYFTHLNEERVGNIIRLLLLIICVLRFHHGNLMVLDKYYLADARKHNNKRKLFFDFLLISAMSIGFSGMGFSTFSPLLFSTSYMFILLFSVIWSTEGFLSQMNIGVAGHELIPQFYWFVVNSVTLAVFCVLYFWPDLWHRSECLLVVIFVNSIFDISLNWKEYFPRIT